MKVLAHLQGQNTCVDILVDIIHERFGVRGFAPSSLDVKGFNVKGFKPSVELKVFELKVFGALHPQV